jgi:hypothetical protein
MFSAVSHVIFSSIIMTVSGIIIFFVSHLFMVIITKVIMLVRRKYCNYEYGRFFIGFLTDVSFKGPCFSEVLCPYIDVTCGQFV